jgi:hypothetical protein
MSPTVITWANNTTEIIDAIRDTIGREITIYVSVSGTACPASGCFLDPITNLSTNPFCPVCSGFHWINTISGYPIGAHIHYGLVDLPVWTPGGYIVEGDTVVQIKYTIANVNAVEHAKSYLVDGKSYIQSKVSYRGVPNLNRILVNLEETDK